MAALSFTRDSLPHACAACGYRPGRSEQDALTQAATGQWFCTTCRPRLAAVADVTYLDGVRQRRTFVTTCLSPARFFPVVMRRCRAPRVASIVVRPAPTTRQEAGR